MTQRSDVKFEYGSTTLELRLAERDKYGKLLDQFPFEEFRADKFALQQWTGNVQETARKADDIIPIVQKYYHGGFGQRNFDITEKFRTTGAGIDTRTKGRAMLPPLVTTAFSIDCTALNAGLESWVDSTTPNNWVLTGTGASVARNTADKETGTYCAAVTRGTNDSSLRQTMTKRAVFVNKEVTITARVKSTNSTVQLVAYNPSIIQGTSHTGGGAYETLTVTWTVGGDTNPFYFDIRIQTAGTFYLDTVTLSVTGGITHTWDGTTIGFFENDSQLYFLTTEELCRWDNTNSKWLIILTTEVTTDSVFTCGAAFGNYIFVGAKDTASPAVLDEWWQATRTEIFARQSQSTCVAGLLTTSQGTFVAKVADNQIKTATAPWTTGSDPMSSATTVCDVGQSITALSPFYDAIMIAYTTGLSYLDSSGNLHAAVRIPGLSSTNNFLNMFPWEGLGQKVLVCPIGINGLYTYEGTYGKMENISPAVRAPQETAWHGRIKCMATDGIFLYVGTDINPTSGKLLAYTYENVGSFTDYVLHPIGEFTTATPTALWVSSLQATNKRLWHAQEASGALNSIGYRILATGNDPSADSACRFATGNSLSGSWIDAGTPGDNKIAFYVDVQGSGLTADKYIQIKYALNGSSSTTTLSSAISDGTTRMYFGVDVTFKEISIVANLVTNVNTATPVVEKVVFACRNAAEPSQMFRMTVQTAGGAYRTGNQPMSTMSTKATMDAIRSMAAQHYVKMTHYLDDDQTGTSHYVTIKEPTPYRKFYSRNESVVELIGLYAPTS